MKQDNTKIKKENLLSKAVYRKSMQDSFMLFDRISEDNLYLENMISENPSDGRLMFHIEAEEGAVKYAYDISGLKKLETAYKKIPLSAGDIGKIVLQITEEIRNGRQYLLSDDDYIIEPGYIYTSIPDYKLCICYYPGYRTALREQFGNFFENLLNHVDYDEDKAVEMIYMLYIETQKDGCTLEDIERVVHERSNVTLAEMQQENREYSLIKDEYEQSNEDISGFFRKFKNKLGVVISRFREEPVLFDEYEVPKADCKTDYLVRRKIGAVPCLISEKTAEQLEINKELCYIGSLKGYTDITVAGEGISRFHASISKKEGGFYLKDLNSSNGTYINGSELEPEMERLLKNGDRLMLGKEVFRFAFE